MKQVISKSSSKNSFDLNKIRKQLVQGSLSTDKFRSMKDKELYDEEIEGIHQKLKEKHGYKYSLHYLPNTKYNKDKVHLLGNRTTIYGFQDDDFNSNDILLNEVEQLNPNALILGNMSEVDMEYLRKGDMKYMTRPKFELIKPEHTLAKKKFTKFFNEEMKQTNRYFYHKLEEDQDYTIYQADDNLKRKIIKPELSLAKYSCSQHNKKLFFGAPNPLLVIEDLAYRLSLTELIDIFNNTLQTYRDGQKQMGFAPAYHPIDIHNNLVEISMNLHADQLYDNYVTYQASFLRKCTKLYKETVFIQANSLVTQLKERSNDPEIAEFDEIYKRDFAESQSYEETIEKLVILTHIFNIEFLKYLNSGNQNELTQELFKGMFKERSDLQDKFNAINMKYRSQLQKLFNEDLKRLEYLPATGRVLLESYDSALKRIDQKLERPQRFVVNPFREINQVTFMISRLFFQIEKNIKKREEQGIDQTQTRIMLNQLFEDEQETPENKQLWIEHAVEANAQLGFFTMPETLFEKYKDVMRRTAYDQMKEVMGEDPIKVYKRNQISEDNQHMRNVYTQLSDGSVPSFEEFKSIKDQIIRTNEGIGRKFSPLKELDKRKETLLQYNKLEQLALQNPDKKEEYQKMQKKLDLNYLPATIKNQIMISEKGDPTNIQQAKPTKMIAINLEDGTQQFPAELQEKTMEELKKLGFKDLINWEFRPDSKTGQMKPHMDPEEKARLQQVFRDMIKDQQDPESHQDPLGEEINPGEDDDELNHPRNLQEKAIFDKIKKQRFIDDQKVALIYKALEKGIPMNDDPVYMDVLEMYPHYQQILEKRQRLIAKVKKMKALQEKGEKSIKYKFEEKQGKSNLAKTIDIESLDRTQIEKDEADLQRYEQIMREYQQDIEMIKNLSSAIEKDVIDEETAVKDEQRGMREDQILEKRLGSKYLTEIKDDEAGSQIEAINEKHQTDMMVESFLQEMQQNVGPQKETDERDFKENLRKIRQNKFNKY